MSTPDSIFPVSEVPPSGTIDADSLMSGYRWGTSGTGGVALTYSFGVAGTSVYQASYATPDPATAWDLSGAAKNAIRAAIASWGAVANISLTEVADTGANCGDIRIGGSASPAVAYTIMAGCELPEGGDVWFGPLFADPGLSWAPGSYAYMTALHELGHALGLKHPHEADGDFPAAPLSVDAQQYTVMSYRSAPGVPVSQGYWQSRFATTPMVDDVLAIQQLYGANMTTNAGDTVYSWRPGQTIFQTIWDAGGHDTIDWSNQTSAALINLAPGSYSALGAPWTAGFSVEPQTLGIAYNCWIESAIGGAGNDTLIGNERSNELYGGAGDDTLIGGGGTDLLDGGGGTDTALFNGSPNDYTIVNTGPDQVTVTGPDGSDTLRSIEHLSFGDITVALNLDAAPGTRVDTFFAVQDAASGRSLLQQAAAYVGPVQNLEWQWLGTGAGEAAAGTSGNDFINGMGGDDAIAGGAGDDVIDGGTGSNFLAGGSGHDTFFVDGRNGQPVWSTVTDLEAGESVAVWGWQDGVSTLSWMDMAGADGFQGATANIDLNGDGTVDVGLTLANRSAGSLMTASGIVGDNGYLSVWLPG